MAIAMARLSTSGRSSTGGGEITSSEPNNNQMHAWWESIAKARSAIQTLISILGPLETLLTLQDSESPAKSLLDSNEVASSISARLLHHPDSGCIVDPLCQWLYETFQAADPDLRLVVLRYVPLVVGLYLSRVVNRTAAKDQPPAGFEAVLLALYTAEAKARRGRQVSIDIPDLGQPSLYHAPINHLPGGSVPRHVGQLCDALEPQVAVKATKRAFIAAVALDLFYRNISLMPPGAKLEFCEFVQGWAGQYCRCVHIFDRVADVARVPEMPTCTSGEISDGKQEIQAESSNGKIKTLIDDMAEFGIDDVAYGSKGMFWGASSSSSSGHVAAAKDYVAAKDDVVAVKDEVARAKGCRIPLPWELLQPVLRILGHCLMAAPLNSQEVRDAASVATRVLFARVSHDLMPEAILATRSLIRLDVAAREAANIVAKSAASIGAKSAASVAATCTASVQPKKPEILLVSK